MLCDTFEHSLYSVAAEIEAVWRIVLFIIICIRDCTYTFGIL